MIVVIPVLYAVTIHEVAHGWVASLLGDNTAKSMGRLSLNPLKHVDPIGTVLVPLAMYLLSGFLFGWAKPVPIDWRNLKSPRRDVALVSAAGPLSNLIMALGWLGIMKLGVLIHTPGLSQPLIYMGLAGIIINGFMLVLNLIPIPPLDGSRIVSAFLPPKWARNYGRIEPYGLVILMALLFSGALGSIFIPVLELLQKTAMTVIQ